MLSAKGLGDAAQGAGKYYIDLAQEDYYTHGGEPAGQWFGQSAARLGLTATVDKGNFSQLLHGFDATGTRSLVQDAGQGHYAGWDLTFSAPKSVSVLWAMTEETAVRAQIQSAQQAAVEATLGFAERHCAFTRRGHDGVEREKVVGLAVATFEHSTSREQDPQLHTHCIVANVAQRTDGTYGSLEGRELYRWKMALGAIYRAELAAQLEARLPVQIVRDQSSFAIAGVPEAIQHQFSKRAEHIKDWMAERGYEGAVAAQTATLDTRTRKQEIGRPILLENWKQEGQAAGWGPTQAAQLLAEPSLTPERPIAMTMKALKEKLVYPQSTFGERDAWRLLAESMQGVGGLNAIQEQMQTFWQCPDLLSVGENRYREERWSTAAVVQREQETLQIAENATQQHAHRLSAPAVEAILKTRPTLTPEQTVAVQYLCERSGAVATVEGLPGTGKSFMLETARAAWSAEGYHVLGAALSGKAALGLQESAHIPSATLHARLQEWQQPGALDAKTVVVVDEAGMIGSRHMAELMAVTHAAGAKLVLVGDHRQLQPIEAGGIFRAMTERIDTAQLTEIRRQVQPWAKDAVQALAQGQACDAIEAYEQRGRLHIGETKPETIQTLVETWAQSQAAQPEKSRLILASERADVRAINEHVRTQLKSADHLSVGQKVTTEYGVREFAVGDRLVMLRNSTAYGVRNGQLGTLEAMSQIGKKTTLRIRLDEGGRLVTLPLQRYGHVDHGYAITTHKSQGATVDETFVLAGGKMANREIGLVQLSRHREAAHVFVDRSVYQPDTALDHAPMQRACTALEPSPELRSAAALTPYETKNHDAMVQLAAQIQRSQQKDTTLDYLSSRQYHPAAELE
jgi:Ti-type conjugative transfer relaxase TraA